MPEHVGIFVLEHPLTHIDYIKRVIGQPGDTLDLRNGELSINGNPVKREVQPMLSIPVDPNLPGPDSSLFRFVSRDARGEPVRELPIVRETLPGGAPFDTIAMGSSESASGWEREGQYVWISVVAAYLKKKKTTQAEK